MLRIYTVVLEVVRKVGVLSRKVAQHDAALADQLRRAGASIALNVAEGSGMTRGNRRMRYESARGSSCEVQACIDVAEAFGYVEPVDALLRAELGQVIATLNKLARA